MNQASNGEMMSCFNYFTGLNCIELAHYLKSILSILLPIVGLLIAYKGLEMWRIQLKGADTYKLAKSVVLRIYEIQELIKTVNPFFKKQGEESFEGSQNYFKHLEYVQNKLIEKKSQISFYLLQLKVIDNLSNLMS